MSIQDDFQYDYEVAGIDTRNIKHRAESHALSLSTANKSFNFKEKTKYMKRVMAKVERDEEKALRAAEE